jgi:type VI secretion system secreted protein VgrG
MRTDERLVLRDQQTGDPIPNQRFKAYLENGSTFDGVTDEYGRTAIILGCNLGRVRFELPPDEPMNSN